MNDYYVNQAGTGIAPFEGVRFQRGHGFFSNFIKGRLLPILKSVLPYLGRNALDAGVNIAQNLKDGNSFKEATKKTLKKKAYDMAEDGLVTLKKQSGLGIRRRRRRRQVVTLLSKPKRRRTRRCATKKAIKGTRKRRRRTKRKTITLF